MSTATKPAGHKALRCAAVFAALAVAVALQSHWSRIEAAFGFGGPSAAQAAQQLGVRVVDARQRARDYRRSAFGEAWTDDTDAPSGHNGCDTRFINTRQTSGFVKMQRVSPSQSIKAGV